MDRPISTIFDVNILNPLFYVNPDNPDQAKGLSPLAEKVFTPTNYYALEKFTKESDDKLCFSGEINYSTSKSFEKGTVKKKKFKIIADKFFFLSVRQTKRQIC